MKCFHTTSYKLYKNGLDKNLKILVISDIHFSSRVSDEKLEFIIQDIEKVNPDYVFIVGDLIDSSNVVKESKERIRLISLVQKIGNLSKTIIVLGNHENYGTASKNFWKEGYDSLLFDEINLLEDVYVLNNLSYEDDFIYVTGFCASYQYYHPNDKEMEKKEILLKELKNNIKEEVPTDKIKFFLFHSPVWLMDDEIKDRLKDYDYFISGHMHNGCVPPLLNEMWKSDRGLISPDKHIFTQNARNTLRYLNDKLIVNGAVTTFHECTGNMQLLNIIYPIYNTILEFTNDKQYSKEKIFVKKKYHV